MKSFNALNYIVGMPLEKAIDQITKLGYTWRVRFTNGTPILLTQDINPGRINLEVKDGVVISIDVG